MVRDVGSVGKARKLLDSDKIDVLLGPMSSASSAAIKTFVSGRGVPCLVQATVDEVSDNRSMFRTTFPASADSFLEGYLAGKAGFKKATAIAPNFNAGQDAVTWFEKGFEAAGGKVVQKLLPRLGTPDFGPYIAQIDESADVGLEAAYKAKPIWQGVSGYVMGQVLDAALGQRAGKLLDKSALFAAMKQVKLTAFRFSEKNEPIQPRYISQVREVNGVIQPVVLGTISEFIPEPKPPQLPAGLTLPK